MWQHASGNSQGRTNARQDRTTGGRADPVGDGGRGPDGRRQYRGVIVHSSEVDGSGAEVGFIGQREEEVLVELPRETLRGRWRVWVPKSAVTAWS